MLELLLLKQIYGPVMTSILRRAKYLGRILCPESAPKVLETYLKLRARSTSSLEPK